MLHTILIMIEFYTNLTLLNRPNIKLIYFLLVCFCDCKTNTLQMLQDLNPSFYKVILI